MRLSAALLVAVLPALLAPALRAEELPPHQASDATAPVVTEENLLASDRYWPYQVVLVEAWRSLPAGSMGVLIRVEARRLARIDFGREGLHEVPVRATDLVERAERIRRGELDKTAPNFVLAIGPRLLDSASDPLRPLSLTSVLGQRGFLAIFADPADPELAAVAAALAPLKERRGLLTVFFPQGPHTDAEVHARLRELSWPAAFVFDHLAEGYTASLLDPRLPKPALQLQTSEGRVLFQSSWRSGVVAELTAALDAALGNDPTSRDTTAAVAP